MIRLLNEIKHDLSYIRSHTLQPQWYKVVKVPLLIGVLICYSLAFGLRKTILFAITFFGLGLIVHMIYRANTRRFTRSWFDFVVVEQGDEIKGESIGKYYYLAIILNLIIALVVSQVLG